jgi:hypothetical protein
MPPTRISDLCEKILDRERVYLAAFESDIAVLTKRHGAGPVQEALQLLGARNADAGDVWDAGGHALAVRCGLARALYEHQERPEDFHSATEV